MKKIDNSFQSATAGQPYSGESFDHLQESYQEILAELSKSVIGTYTTNDVQVLTGCVLTGDYSGPGNSFSVSAGSVYYNGEVYLVDAVSGTISGTNVLLGTITTTYASFDPIEFTDQSTHSVHKIRKMVISQGVSGSGDADFSDWKVGTQNLTQSTTTNGQTIQVNIVSAGPFAYNNDTYKYSYYVTNRICHLSFKIVFDTTDGAVVDRVDIPLPKNIVKSTSAGENYAIRGLCMAEAPTATTDYISLMAYSDYGGAEGQRISLIRMDGTKSITWETGKTITLRGQISFPLA